MDERKYYECLQRIPGIDGNVNSLGFVVNNSVPFLHASDAVKYALKLYPDMKPGSDFVVRDTKNCRKLARTILSEIQRITNEVEEYRNQKSEEINKKAEERDRMTLKSLFDKVEKQLLQEAILEKIGYHSALCDCMVKLHDRNYELSQCAGLKDDGK